MKPNLISTSSAAKMLLKDIPEMGMFLYENTLYQKVSYSNNGMDTPTPGYILNIASGIVSFSYLPKNVQVIPVNVVVS